MTAIATFHFAAQASRAKYLIAPSASVTATGDSTIGIDGSVWAVVSAYGSVVGDWVLSGQTAHVCIVTAPAGSNKSCILQRTVTSGRDRIVTTAKIYSGTETICPNETDESDQTNGWGPLVDAILLGGGGPSPYASTPAANTASGSAGALSDYARGDHAHPVQNPIIATGALGVGQTSQNTSVLGDVTVVQGATSNRLRSASLLMRDASDNTKATHTVADAYVQNYAVSCDIQSGGLSRVKADANDVTLNTSASGKISIREATTEFLYVDLNGATTEVHSLSNQIDMYGASLQFRSGNFVSYNAAAYIQFSAATLELHTTGGVCWQSRISPAAIGANQTDYNPAGILAATDLRQDVSAACLINSLVAGTDGQTLRIWNISSTGANTLTLRHDDGTGTASMRFLCPNNANYVIRANGGAAVRYDGVSSRWRVLDA